MSKEIINNDNEFNTFFNNIKDLVINSRNKVYQTVNIEMLNLYWNMGKSIFYICFPIETTVSSQLSWSHYLELIKIEEKKNFELNEEN